jgi:hypothetical protein
MTLQKKLHLITSVSDPDPYWIRIRIGSGSVLDPDAISSVDLDPYSESGARRAKMTHKSRKNKEISCFEVLDVLF